MLHAEFRDGNAPAGFEQKRVPEEAIECLPEGVKKVWMRSNTAGYQHELLKYCDREDNKWCDTGIQESGGGDCRGGLDNADEAGAYAGSTHAAGDGAG